MAVEVFSRRGKTLLRLVPTSSMGGEDLLVRMRSVWFALLGLVTAVGLGLVAFISQQGWPGVLDGPIPDVPFKLGIAHNEAAAPVS